MDNTRYLNYQKPWQTASFYNNNNVSYPANNAQVLVAANQIQQPANNTQLYYFVDIPVELAKSLEGKYFVGVAEDIEFGNATNAWARLYNPPDSGVNMFVNVWTVSDVVSSPIRVQIYFNSTPPGIIQESTNVSPANTAIIPLPQPKVKLEYAIAVRGLPTGGIKTFGRSGPAAVTINSEENGKFIFPPGGSFLVFIGNPETPTRLASGRIAFGWWEEPIQQ
ncbi:MAG: DUF6143 family protein [Sedimentibacter sp.]